MDAEVVNASNTLAKTILEAYGPWGTFGILSFILFALAGWKFWADWKTDREVHLALAEKEKTIQRMANMERFLRAALFKHLGWTEKDIMTHIYNGGLDVNGSDGEKGKTQ